MKQKTKDVFINNKGSALLTVLILLLILTIIGSSVMVTTMNNLNVAKRMSEYEDTYYIAEANAQYAVTFMKEEITQLYMGLYAISPQDPFLYENELAAFYPSLVDAVCTDAQYADTCKFVPIDYSDEGMDITVHISVDPSTPLPTNNFGDPGDAVRFLIECIAESDTSRRVVNAELVIEDPDISWDMTSAPPMTDMRLLIGVDLILEESEYNAIFCRSSALTGHAFNPQFLTNHAEFLNSFTYDFSNSVPKLLRWDLQFRKFPTHLAFSGPEYPDSTNSDDDFNALFAASTVASATYDTFFDWRSRTINYSIPNYSPNDYPASELIENKYDIDTALGDYYYRNSRKTDYNNNEKYIGTATDPVRVYAKGDLEIGNSNGGLRSIEHCYIVAKGYVYIRLTNGHVSDTIIISQNEYVTIDCKYIRNSSYKLIQAKYDINIYLDKGQDIDRVVGKSRYGSFYLGHSDGDTKKKILATRCYFYTNKDSASASMLLKNVYLLNSYVNVGKDLILLNCSGRNSSLYARGSTDSDGTSYLYFGTKCYNRYMQYNACSTYGFCRDHKHRYYRGIIMISQLNELAGTSRRYENVFDNCDFTTEQTIFLSDPAYSASHGNNVVDLNFCRIMADREVLIEDVTMEGCFIFSGIAGYETEQEFWYGTLKRVRGTYIRADRKHNEILNCVFYSRGRNMYSQHTPENSGYALTEEDKVRVYNSFFYSKRNFEYNGTSASEGIDETTIRNDSSLCNHMIIMTEENVMSHEFSPSIGSDVLFIGGSMGLPDDPPNYSTNLFELIGGPETRGIDDSIDVQTAKLYDNYFEQLLDLDEIMREVPVFGDIFIYEDIYEKKKAQ